MRWPDVDAEHRVGLLKLIWDAVGSEFAGRHFQYEMFYAGSASVVQGRLYRNYDWERARSMVLRCLADTPGPPRGGRPVTAPEPVGVLDTGFRTALSRLDRAGLLARVSRTVDFDLEIAAMMKHHDAGAALLFESVKDQDVPVVGNVFATPESSEVAMGLDRDRLRAALARGIHPDIEPAVVSNPPAQQQVVALRRHRSGCPATRAQARAG